MDTFEAVQYTLKLSGKGEQMRVLFRMIVKLATLIATLASLLTERDSVTETK